MIDISVQNIIKAFEEGNNILDGISFDVVSGERVGLLGKNGAGKTTLLKIITGEISEDEGSVIIPAGRKLGCVSQIPVYPENFTVENVLRSAFKNLDEIKSEMKRLEQQMADGDSAAATLAEYDRLSFDYQRLGGYTTDTELGRVTNGLQIPPAQLSQRFNTLSGGERTRINLARLILENTDVLLLDEPTNHLDMRATIWLEDFISKFKGTVIVISHDRYFLDKTISRVIEINSGTAEFYNGNYSFYVREKQRRFEEQLERYEREQAEVQRLNKAADRLQQWGTGNSKLMRKSFAIRTRAERAAVTDKPDKDKTMRSRFAQREFRADEVLLIRGVTKAYNNKVLFKINGNDSDELQVKGKERIAIIGDNGTGKSTLAKMMTGEVKPDTGFIRAGPSVKQAYLPQIVSFAHPGRSILDTMIYELDVTPQTARNRLGAYLFTGDDVYKQVGDLSGGEKSRLRLCMLMNGEINLLILDEPTNHLDLPSREWMENALTDYDEALIFISHDRYFINRFATRIWEISDGVLTDFHGGYSQYMINKEAAERSNNDKPKRSTHESGSDNNGINKNNKNNGINKNNKNNAGKNTPVIHNISQTSLSRKPAKKPSELQKEIRRLEREIDKLEGELAAVRTEKENHSYDYKKLLELEKQESQISALIDDLLVKWDSLQ